MAYDRDWWSNLASEASRPDQQQSPPSPFNSLIMKIIEKCFRNKNYIQNFPFWWWLVACANLTRARNRYKKMSWQMLPRKVAKARVAQISVKNNFQPAIWRLWCLRKVVSDSFQSTIYSAFLYTTFTQLNDFLSSPVSLSHLFETII